MLDIWVYSPDFDKYMERIGGRVIKVQGSPDFKPILQDILESRNSGKIAILGKIFFMFYNYV
jgi:thiamine pyrophosphate-dependent acetolactate synthase large subunit-like protein